MERDSFTRFFWTKYSEIFLKLSVNAIKVCEIIELSVIKVYVDNVLANTNAYRIKF